MMLQNKIWYTLFGLLFQTICFAQQFKYTAQLEPIERSGFYNIQISPELSAYIKTDFSDIRVTDKNKHWVPHILQPANPVFQKEMFTAFSIVENKVTDSGKNLLVIETNKPGGIYNLQLFVKNTAVSRTAVLSGSNNLSDWYTIDDNIILSRSYETVRDEYLQEISFPLSTYRYLKLVINNLRHDPLYIIRAGFYQSSLRQKNNFLQNPAPIFIQKDIGNISTIEVKQRNSYHFDQVSIWVSGSKFYSRDAEVQLPNLGKNHSNRQREAIAGFKLQPAQVAGIELPRTRAGLFYIVINNADNQPLKIDSVTTQQQSISLVSYLEQGKKYDLVFGDSLSATPNYDLKAFEDSIVDLHPLKYGTIQAISKTGGRDKNKGWVWPVIVIAALALGYLCFRLVADMSKTKR